MAGGRESSGAEGGSTVSGQPVVPEASDVEFEPKAESKGRKGRSRQARRLANRGLETALHEEAGPVALALTLLDLGDLEGARSQLAQILAPAEDSDRVTRPKSSMRPERESDPSPTDGATGHRDRGDEFLLDRSPVFATQTMAGLLDRQGDHIRADVIRERLAERVRTRESVAPAQPVPEPRPQAARVLETLDTWLQNLQRESP